MSVSGDRHLREDARVRLGEPVPSPRTVRVVTTEAVAATFSGQATLALLVDLLARQFGVVDEVWVDVNPVLAMPEVFPRTKPPVGTRLDAALVAVGRDAGGSEVAVSQGREGIAAIVVSVGAAQMPEARLQAIACFGNGMKAWCSADQAPPVVARDLELPFGPHLAACIAADHVFRALHGLDVRGTFDIDLATFEAPDWSTIATNDAPSTLPLAYLVGLGAVGAALLNTFAAAPTIQSSFVGLDFDRTDATSRNRLLSMSYDSIGQSKAVLAKALVDGTTVAFWSNSLRWEEYQTKLTRVVPPSARALEPIHYEWILSAVDKNLARRNLANVMPRHVLAGSTDGLVAQATYYSMVGSCECLACNHPVPTLDLDRLKADFGSLSADDRSRRLVELGTSAAERAAVEDYLRNPSCGQAGEAVIRRLGLADATQWAVGFVSVAAGIMLAARFWVLAQGSGQAPDDAEARLFFYGSGSAAMSPAIRKAACDLCGDPQAQARFGARWLGQDVPMWPSRGSR
jgi:hypothetical protein